MEIVRSISGGRDLEARLHKRFAASRSSGEWFHLNEDDLSEIAAMLDEEEPESGRVTATPVPEDEFSDNIVVQTRFYLNELVKREWRGMGDTIEQARDRVMEACSLSPSYGFRLWNKPQEMKDVSGEVYRCLHLKLVMHRHDEGSLLPHDKAFIHSLKYTYFPRPEWLDAANGEWFGREFISRRIAELRAAELAA
jgi:hypothetical protein